MIQSFSSTPFEYPPFSARGGVSMARPPRSSSDGTTKAVLKAASGTTEENFMMMNEVLTRIGVMMDGGVHRGGRPVLASMTTGMDMRGG
ncbi:hypothetical protein Tdes44962_MAKER10374 [Teratosphaeria destructans]|uniref:Uncharacterized protein n=1 Tax=Teratosphaeria destructans TaxID=418781 RepID=A0A9W7SJP7_9PEZI|nr:hypothetical protein Tdes44962_MAKER10374 [Teratosphaeria destructans]